MQSIPDHLPRIVDIILGGSAAKGTDLETCESDVHIVVMLRAALEMQIDKSVDSVDPDWPNTEDR